MDHIADTAGEKHYVDWKREDVQLMISELGFHISNNQNRFKWSDSLMSALRPPCKPSLC